MEKISTKGFTPKDEFNATSATPIKEAKNNEIVVTDVMIKDKTDGETVGYIKAQDGTVYATISTTVIEQLIALVDMLEAGPQTVVVVPHNSNAGREYFLLELK